MQVHQLLSEPIVKTQVPSDEVIAHRELGISKFPRRQAWLFSYFKKFFAYLQAPITPS